MNNNNKKRAGGVAQAVECLNSKLEALSSNPSTTKKQGRQVNARFRACHLCHMACCLQRTFFNNEGYTLK
jgi:hypothetical protein